MQARRDILAFAHHMKPTEPPARHHRVMGRFFMALLNDKIDRLMVLAPPRSAKSLYCKYFAALMLGQRPDTKIVHTTHTAPLAGDVGYSIRNMINSPLYPWPHIKVASDRAARTDWVTTGGGAYFGTSMGAGPTGRPANLLITDDPLTNREDADSETIRKKQWDEYTDGLRSRMQPWADGTRPKELLMLTHWNEDDIAGRHLPEDYDGRPGRFTSRMIEGEEWVVCSLPALAEHGPKVDLLGRRDGEWLWPERFGDGSSYDSARKLGGRTWSALYQQRPGPATGVLIQSEWIQYYDKLPPIEELEFYAASDYATRAAGKDNKDPDWTVHMIFAVDRDWNVYVVDMWRARTTADKWIEPVISLAKKWKPLIWAEEKGQIIGSVGPFLQRRLLDEGVPLARWQFTSTEAKGRRAGEMAAQNTQSLIGMLGSGKWFLPRSTPWSSQYGSIEDVVKEMLSFPAGRHDDTVDCMTLFCRMIAKIIAGRKPEDESKPDPETFAGRLAIHDQLNGIENEDELFG